MLGFFAELNNLIDKKTLLKSTLRMVPVKFKTLNEKAFKTGMKYAQIALKEEDKK